MTQWLVGVVFRIGLSVCPVGIVSILTVCLLSLALFLSVLSVSVFPSF
jgi:hypothetical protein